MKKVSIIVPCYNVQDYIRECMDSLIGQTIGIEELEIIVVDDASTDGTLAILKEYEERFPKSVMLIPLLQNQKQGYARNIALSYATGEYIMYVDSDDWLLLSAVDKLYNRIKEAEADVLEFGFLRAADKDHLEGGVLREGKCRIWDVSSDFERRKFAAVGFASGVAWNKIYKTSFLQKHQIVFAEGVKYEDTLFSVLLLLYIGKYVLCPDAFYFYRLNEQGTMRSCMVNDFGQFDRTRAQIQLLKLCGQRNLLEKHYETIEANFVRIYYVETLIPIVQRFTYFPEREIKEMQQTVLALFPNYRHNGILNMPHNQWMERWLATIETEFGEALFWELKQEVTTK